MEDDDLRAALHAHAAGTNAGHPDWAGVEARRAAAARRVRARAAAGVAAAILTVLVGVAVVAGDGDEPAAVVAGPSDTTSTSSSTTTSTTASTTTSTAAPAATLPDAEAYLGVWPYARGADVLAATDEQRRRHADPDAVAYDFVFDYLGMPEARYVATRLAEPGLMEYDFRPNDRATITTTLQVRRAGEEGSVWTVASAQTPGILLESPEVLSDVNSPIRLAGQARAFEGTVQVQIRQAGQTSGEALGEGFVTGSGGPDLGPFEGEISFERPDRTDGAIVLLDASAEDGSPLAATVVPVRFQAGD